MDQLRRVLATIQAAYGQLTPTHKLLAASLAVVLVMTLFLVNQYTAKPDMVPLLDASYSPEEQAEASTFLKTANVSYEQGPNGELMVPATEHRFLLARMSQQGALPGDTSTMFEDLLSQRSWTMTSDDRRTASRVALQNELSFILSQWDGISKAAVILDVPDRQAIGKAMRRPTASVNVFTRSGVTPETVDAIAAFVSGAVAGLEIDDVRVIDGTTRRQYRARDEQNISAATTQELIAQVERSQRNKILDLLAPQIPGVIVAVHAQVDSTRRQRSRDAVLPEGKGSGTLLSQELRSESEVSSAQRGGEPGARANTRLDVNTGGSTGTTSTEETTDTDFDTRFGTESEQIIDPRGFATKINAVITIPRDHIERIVRATQPQDENADDAAPVDDAALDAEQQREVTRVTDLVRGLIDTSSYDGADEGDVIVSVSPVSFEQLPSAAPTQNAGLFGIGVLASGPGGGLSGTVKTVGLGGLAVLALGLVVFTALRASKQEELPSAEELVGIPPALDTDEEIVGEAEGIEPPLQGIELSDDEMKKRKMGEQITDMVRDRPEDAAKIVQRWMADSD